jgi:hypothetical protein
MKPPEGFPADVRREQVGMHPMADLPDLGRTETAIVERTNAFRKAQGLEPVRRNKALDRAANEFARYLAGSGRFAHEADGRKPADRAKAAGYWYCQIAENLALNLDSRGFTVEKLAGQVMEGWKASPGHRKNLLLPHVTEIGVGIAPARSAEPKLLTVQLFGRPKSLAYAFSIANRTAKPVSYAFAGEQHELAPRTIVTHEACQPGEVHFMSSGAAKGGKGLDVRYEAADKTRFVLRSGTGGGVEVEIQR